MFIQSMMMKALILLAFCILGHSEYCFSQCQSPTVNTSCGASPYTCTLYDPLFTSLGTFAAGYSQVEMVTSSAITTANNFKMSSTFASTNCSLTYNSTGLTFPYNILGQFVSTDFIYKRYTIIKPHYQVSIRLSMVFIGVWGPSDYLNLYTFDGTTGRNFPMRYSCADLAVNYTEMLCGNRTGNKVDCIYSYTISFPHNSTSLLVNFSSLTSIKDSNVQYWSIFDLNIATQDCNSLCASCFNSALSACTSCAASSFLTGNSCGGCAGGLLQLPNANPLLGGICVTSCPPGYFVSGTSCSACATGCLSCTSALTCLTTSSSVPQATLWTRLLPLWIIIIIVGGLILIGIAWKLCFIRETLEKEERERIISQSNQKHGDEKMTTQERQEPINNEKNVYIEEIDFNDHIKVDNNPRKRKRQERDMNRSNININF